MTATSTTDPRTIAWLARHTGIGAMLAAANGDRLTAGKRMKNGANEMTGGTWCPPWIDDPDNRASFVIDSKGGRITLSQTRRSLEADVAAGRPAEPDEIVARVQWQQMGALVWDNAARDPSIIERANEAYAIYSAIACHGDASYVETLNWTTEQHHEWNDKTEAWSMAAHHVMRWAEDQLTGTEWEPPAPAAPAPRPVRRAVEPKTGQQALPFG